MKKIIEYLEKLDFTKTEAKFYLCLLQKGAMTVSELAEKTNTNRTASYAHVKALLEKGVIYQATSTTNKFVANPPTHLHYLLDQKLSNIRQLEEQLNPLVSLLNTSFMRSQHLTDSEIRQYKGRTGIRAIYEDCLSASKIRSYFNPKEIFAYLPENIGIFDKALANNKKMEICEIVEDSPLARKRASSLFHTSRHFWKYLPNGVKLTSNDILIYNNKVAIINLIDEKNFAGFVLKNKDYYNNSVQLFDLLWKLLP